MQLLPFSWLPMCEHRKLGRGSVFSRTLCPHLSLPLTVTFQLTVWRPDLGSFSLRLVHFLFFCWCLDCKRLQFLWAQRWLGLFFCSSFSQWLHEVLAKTLKFYMGETNKQVVVLFVWCWALVLTDSPEVGHLSAGNAAVARRVCTNTQPECKELD